MVPTVTIRVTPAAVASATSSAAGGSPLVELGLFRERVFVRGLLTTLAFYGGLSAFFLSFTLFLQDGLGLTPAQAGAVFTPFAVGFLARVKPDLIKLDRSLVERIQAEPAKAALIEFFVLFARRVGAGGPSWP